MSRPVQEPSLVYGVSFINPRLEKLRADESLCGIYGKWFKKKMTFGRDGIYDRYPLSAVDNKYIYKMTGVPLIVSNWDGSHYVLDSADAKPGAAPNKKRSWLCRLIRGNK
jgi:hypothetical protein